MALCCGGGGLVPSTGDDIAAKVRTLRIEDVLESGVDDLVTACPNCEFTLSGQLRARGGADAPRVVDIVDVLYASVFGVEK
jgi:Fe-S oxidoreductase